MSRISDKRLASEGMEKCRWASDHMPVLCKIARSHAKPLSDTRVGFCLQLTAETAALILAVQKLGAKVSASSGNPLTTDDAIAAYLDSEGVRVYGWSGQSAKEFSECADSVMRDEPDIVADDGAELSVRAHTDGRFSECNILGGTEETTTGIRRDLAMQNDGRLRFPIVAVNDADTKRMFDNRYGTGQSTVDALLRTTGLLLASKIAVVCGYGWVGRGVAERMRAMGCRVAVTEVDPTRALDAHMDGYDVMPMSKAARIGDLFITCTGNSQVISGEHLRLMRDGAILANAGHFDVEIDTARLGRGRTVRPNLQEHVLCKKKLYLLSRGRVANLAAATGHPPEIMDLSFSNHLECILYVGKNHSKMQDRIHGVPKNIDRCVAGEALRAAGVKIDRLTPRQIEYSANW